MMGKLILLSAMLVAAPAFAQDGAAAPAALGYDPPSAAARAQAQAEARAPLGYDAPSAQSPASSAGVVALSAEAREQALEAGASRGKDDLGGGTKRGIHGEVGMEMGSHGTHALWGTAAVPLGDTGTAVVSVMTGSENYRWHR
jgi:hypothetical protein